MRPLTLRAGSCDGGLCPNIFDYAPQPDVVAVQGTRLTNPDALAQLSKMPDHENRRARAPHRAARVRPCDLRGGDAGMTFEEFDACFDRFERSTFRLETLQHYAVPQEDEGFRAFREGTPRPERSVRTSPWLRRIALTTAAGKHWQRVHIVEHPLSEYLRYQMEGYELCDAEADHIFAILMHYDPAGHVLDFEHTDDPGTLRRCRAQRDLALQHSVGLNTYLATERATGQVA